MTIYNPDHIDWDFFSTGRGFDLKSPEMKNDLLLVFSLEKITKNVITADIDPR